MKRKSSKNKDKVLYHLMQCIANLIAEDEFRIKLNESQSSFGVNALQLIIDVLKQSKTTEQEEEEQREREREREREGGEGDEDKDYKFEIEFTVMLIIKTLILDTRTVKTCEDCQVVPTLLALLTCNPNETLLLQSLESLSSLSLRKPNRTQIRTAAGNQLIQPFLQSPNPLLRTFARKILL